MQETDLGTILKEARQVRGLSVGDVSDILRIRARYIVALEGNSITDLPGNVYFQGYLKGYAELLHLDYEAIRQHFFKVEQPPSPAHLPAPYYDESTPNRRILWLSLIAALSLYSVWYYIDYTHSRQPIIPLRTIEQALDADLKPGATFFPVLSTPKNSSHLFDESNGIFDSFASMEILLELDDLETLQDSPQPKLDY